jgi:hypothetical protein
MAEADFTRGKEATIKNEFERFSWVRQAQQTQNTAFLETVYNVTNGAQLALQIVHTEHMAEDNDANTIFSKNDVERLLLLATTSLELLKNATFDRIERINDQAR